MHRVSELLRKVVFPVPFLEWQPFGVYLAAKAGIGSLVMALYDVSSVREPDVTNM